MQIRRVAPLLGLIVFLGLAPQATADHLVEGIGHEGPCPNESPSCQANNPDPLANPPVDGNGPLAQKKANLLDDLGNLASDALGAVGNAAGAVADAGTAAAKALGEAVAAGWTATRDATLAGTLAFGRALVASAEAAADASVAAGRALAHAALATLAALGAAAEAYVRFWTGLKPANLPAPDWTAVAVGSSAVAASGASLGLWALARKLAPVLAAIPGFSRIAKDELLENERRSRIFEMIKQNPGIRLSDVARGLDLPWGSCVHHLRKLRADRLILFKHVGAHKCYFINGSGLNEHEMNAASLVQGATIQQVTHYIGNHPRTSLKELAHGLGISSPLAVFHVSKLERAGMIQKVRDGRSVRLVLAASLPSATLATPPVAAPAMSFVAS